MDEAARVMTTDRIESDLSRIWEVLGIGKQDLKAAVDAVDDWVTANTASFNSALPLPARTGMTADQKARLLMYVVAKRWEVDYG